MLKKQSRQHKSRTISATIIQIGSSQSCSNPLPPVSTLTLLGTKNNSKTHGFLTLCQQSVHLLTRTLPKWHVFLSLHNRLISRLIPRNGLLDRFPTS
ncbi:hypothetical protein AL464_25190 [Vibrio parahaemolyticus]|nr:hypothetical protein AL464_25190 [Vibrio parahaemolyticus]